MIAFLVDADICIDWLTGSDPGRQGLSCAMARRQVAVSTIVEAQLWAGVADARDARAVHRLLGLMPVLRFDRADARGAGLVRRELGRGRIGADDELIAGACRVRGLGILTRNASDFGRVGGLRVIAPQ